MEAQFNQIFHTNLSLGVVFGLFLYRRTSLMNHKA